MAMFRPVRLFFDPLIAALFPIPKVALMPLLLLAFGFGDASKIALVAIAVFFPVIVNTYVGAANIDKIYWDVAKNYGASQTVMFTRIVFFGALPMIFAGLRIALAVSFIVLVAAEFVATKAGIGYLIWNSWELLQVDVMFVGIVTVGILGLISSALFQEIERKVIPWKFILSQLAELRNESNNRRSAACMSCVSASAYSSHDLESKEHVLRFAWPPGELHVHVVPAGRMGRRLFPASPRRHSAASAVPVAPQHIRIQPVSQGVPMTAPDQWDFTTLDGVLTPILSVGDHSPELQLATAPAFMNDAQGHLLRSHLPTSRTMPPTWCVITTPVDSTPAASIMSRPAPIRSTGGAYLTSQISTE